MKRSFAYFRPSVHVLAGICAILLASCASTPPPHSEISAAQRALQQADEADADQYAPDRIEAARAELAQAQAALSSRPADARELALRATAAADLAAALSRQAQADAELAQRRAEVARLREQLRLEDLR